MKKAQKITIIAALVLALTFPLSCSSDGSNPADPDPSSSSNGTSSSSGVSSSSVSSSSSIAIIHGDPVEYEDEIYQTVVIGTQTWFAKNLNYEVEGSKCYEEDDDNCDSNGRLYEWSAAMDFGSECNTENCISDTDTHYQGICPDGWHIPNNAEFITLAAFVGGTGTDNLIGASAYLKAGAGWDSYNEVSGNGLDSYGFSALPSGYGHVDGRFVDLGTYGNWWIASEFEPSRAYRWHIQYTDNNVFLQDNNKAGFCSVRCVKDL